MTNSIVEKIIKPANCALGFGIPTLKPDFHSDLNKENKDFAKHYGGKWRKYYHQFISILHEVEPILLNMGITIEYNMTLADYRELLRQKEVVILFSHWHKDKVEFHDGLKDISEIVQTIPISFDGIIDLCICHPTQLSFLIRKKRPNCLVRYIPNKATPAFWLHFYLVLFKHLQKTDNTYLTALEEVIAAFLIKTKK